MGRYFTLILFLVLGITATVAQESYSVHTIQKGESVYRISKQYGVSMNAIFELNPGSEDIIYAGNTLRIPNSVNTNTTTNTTVNDANNIYNYSVKRGETKSGLSRRFGVSIAMLEQQNPHIVSMLQAGHVINVDKTIAQKQPTTKEGEHRVVKGETLWGIAKQNSITLAQLETANAGRLSEFLQIGQILIVPDKNSKIAIDGEYLVARGDTKFQLAKRFNMSIDELEEKNPHIVPMLMAGHKLNIDTTVVETPKVNPNTNIKTVFTEIDSTTTVDGYKNYVIEPKETLFGLSKKAGMTIAEFTKLNPKLLTSVNAGDIIKMPMKVTQAPVKTEITDNTVTKTDSLDTKPRNISTKTGVNKNESLYSNLITETVNGLYFYSPFSSEELGSAEQRQKMIGVNADFQKYIDFFQGAQIAIDSAKALNLNFDVTLIKKNIAKSKITIESPYPKNALLVPFSESGSQFPSIATNQSISIIDIESNIRTNDNINIYKSIPSDNFQKTSTLKYLAKQNAQIVVVSDLDEAKNKEFITSMLPDAKFLKVDNAGFFKSNELENVLHNNKLNYIVLDSDKTIILLNTTTALMSKSSTHNIQLVMLESSLLPKQSEVSDMRYRILKLIFPAITDPQNKKDISEFENNYETMFSSKPSRNAILGFNVTLDILLRLSQNKALENIMNTIISEQPHLKFDYHKMENGNYSNTGIYLMQYNADEGMIELDQKQK